MKNIPSLSWQLDHIAHAVRNLSAGIERYEKSLGFSLLVRETAPEHGVEVAFLQAGNTLIELIAPLTASSALHKFLDKHGERVHHVAFCVNDINLELAGLASQGVELLDKTPRKGARGMQVAFLHPKATGGVMIELCASPR